IAAEAGAAKRPGQLLVGFAAETDDLAKNARAKMERKGLDVILANDVSAGAFGSDENTLRMILRDPSSAERTFSGGKEEVADAVWEALVPLLARRGRS
ncbi:MAG: bifunctional phosphopantothenoylcysteine decarboxylase/phosphopantothenate--cysteine ligase CoaBC, partial [Synergistaceae bacterium]|nr:bifunctional phosphopantothenoylcysteine decarboxylase/phosphopantothenate--cysteine ligase CoaBC [Synergistaceae bacterium]